MGLEGPRACGGEEGLLADPCGALAGYEECADGSAHRHTSVPCNTVETFEPCVHPDSWGCETDKECVQYPNGQCAQFTDFTDYCSCRYPCTDDDECGPAGACVCPTTWMMTDEFDPPPFYSRQACVPAECRTDAECGGLRCGVSIDGCYRVEGLYCRTVDDECGGPADCAFGERCAYDFDVSRWTCLSLSSCE